MQYQVNNVEMNASGKCTVPNQMQHNLHRMKSVEPEAILIGKSHAMEEVRSAISMVAKSPTAVLITGESGTGKEVVARMIHFQSDRSENPFVAINCAALPKDIIESELYGYEKGAFTGAQQKKAGCFELAHNGTLFFDELAEMNIDTQAKLLRVIEKKSFRRLGGTAEVEVDVRALAATNRDISIALKSQKLREDLYYRFSVIEIFLPPLRDRKEDIPFLIPAFLSMFCDKYNKPRQRFSNDTLDILTAYDWPGNIRELKNFIERAVVMCPDEIIGPRYLPDRIVGSDRSGNRIHISVGTSLKDAEKALILQTLSSVGGNKSEAARLLGISRRALLYKVQEYAHET